MKKEITKDEVIKNTMEEIEHLFRLNVPIGITINHDGRKSFKIDVKLNIVGINLIKKKEILK